MDFWTTVSNGYSNYAFYFLNEIRNPGWHNFFYWLIGISTLFLCLEWFRPWRENQKKFRKDFWLDLFYMFFNFFLFSLIVFNAASDVVVNLFNDLILSITKIDLEAINPMNNWPLWAVLLTGFLIRDHVQWWVHRLLHRSDWLWEFHKVHHSVQEMGFAAHLRYHWMETVVYRTCEYIPLALLGIGLYDFFIIHIFTLMVGHYNHSNISVRPQVSGAIFGFILGLVASLNLLDLAVLTDWLWWHKALLTAGLVTIGYFGIGPFMKILFNSPEMHIWHHAYNLPEDRQRGINFGLTLAIWDYIFGTAHIPYDGKNIRLGFPGIKRFPTTFFGQITHGFLKKGVNHENKSAESLS